VRGASGKEEGGEGMRWPAAIRTSRKEGGGAAVSSKGGRGGVVARVGAGVCDEDWERRARGLGRKERCGG
jgi:hypothetical protein